MAKTANAAPVARVKVRATQDGHDGKQYRATGQVFHVDAERLKDGSTWFEPADPEPVDDQ